MLSGRLANPVLRSNDWALNLNLAIARCATRLETRHSITSLPGNDDIPLGHPLADIGAVLCGKLAA